MNEHDIGCQFLPILYKRAKEAYQEEHRTYHDIFTLKPASVSMELLNEYNLFMDREVKYSSIKEAVDELGLHHSNIVACCNGRRSACGGMKWRYVD